MPKLLLISAAILLLDVFPGGGCACPPSTTAGPCQTTCDCSATMAAPIRCPGQWACNANKTCEYTCFDSCTADGGCATAGEACSDAFCRADRSSCP